MIQQLFFELIQVAIGTRMCLSHSPTVEEWKMLYEIAKKQSLVGVCFAGVQKLQAQRQEPPEMLYLTWMGMAAKIQQRNETVNRQCVELQEKLAADGFRSYIMKGQAVGSLYKVADSQNCGESSRAGTDPAREKTVENRGSLQMLRQSGDIDVYLEGGLEKVLAYARTFGEVKKVNELEMSVPVFQDPSTRSGEPTEVEFHYRPFIMRNPWKNRRLQRFFKELEEACFENRISLGEGLTICAPTTEFNLVHQLAHIHLHLFTEGIGMRQLMDYYFVLKTLFVSPTSAGSAQRLKGECIENVKNVVSDLGLTRFASALMWVILYVFEGQNSINPKPSSINLIWEPNEKDGRLLLSEVMQSGNFGHNDEVLNRKKQQRGYSVWALFFRNLKFARFDRGDWFWGPLWRITHKITNLKFKIK